MKICLRTRKFKNLHYLSAFEEYRKRLSRDVKWSELSTADAVIVMSRRGERVDSAEFAKRLQECALQGKSRLLIHVETEDAPLPGGTQADWTIQLIDSEVDPELFAVLAIEQLYRAFRIMEGSSYHK